MTSDETRTYGFGPHLTRQPLLEAMLCLWLSLMFRAVSTLRMIFNRKARDWHTDDAREVLPSATSSISQSGPNQSSPSFSGKPKAHPENPGSLIVGTADIPHAAINRDARDKPEHDTVGAAITLLEACKARVPRAGGDPDLRAAQTHIHQSALTRADQTPALILRLSKDAGDSVVRPARLKSA